jgi:DNA-binding CsgD family transcriptional regulator
MFILIGALLLFRRWGVKQTQKKEQLQHEKREQELIRLRNDKLRSEVRFKSKELANSTMAIIRKNEFLIDLKNIVRKQKEELGSRYPDKYFNYLNNKIDENISSRDDRQIFENNFERAHEQFFQKMKNKYPDLTSSDLQLCAYLRMNLSSKEIAPLLGISIRGVENHRYKLRKKLNLQPEDSLTDVMFSV